jgi:hypothetical protein
MRGSDVNEARQRVLQRFGDPAAVARRLWLDAIGGKIMAQRVLVATCLVVTFVSLVLAGAMWHQGNQTQRESARATAEAIHAMTLQSERAQSSQQEMLKQLRAMSEAIHSTRSFDWNPVIFQLTEETPAGPPAAEFEVTLTAQAVEGGKGGVDPSTRRSDHSGIVDFGVVHPGRYTFNISKSWDQSSVNTSGQLIIEPGSQIKENVVCPKGPLERVPVRVRCNWPADLEKEGLVLYATFVLNPIRLEHSEWNFQENGTSSWRSFFGASRSALCGPGKSIAEVLSEPFLWDLPGGSNVWAELRASDLRPIHQPEETMKWVRGTYRLATLFVLRPGESSLGESRRHFELVVSGAQGLRDGLNKLHISPGLFVTAWGEAPPDEALLDPFTARRLPPRTGPPNLVLPDDYWGTIATAFEARAGRVNEWTIPLPDELIATVRESLKAAK